MPLPVFDQATFRLRNDDGSETTATWRAELHINGNVPLDTAFRLRFTIDETASKAWTDKNWNLYVSRNSGAYVAVAASGTAVIFSASDNFADGDDCTQQLGTFTGSFLADNNGMKETTGGVTNTGTNGNYFETEWCLKINSAVCSNNDTLDFKIYDGSTEIGSYSYIPRVTAAENAIILTIPDDYHAVSNDGIALEQKYFITANESYHTLFNDSITLDSGITEVIKTIKPSGGDYASLAEWQTARAGDITAAGRNTIEIAECYAMEDTSAVVLSGWTTDADHYVKIYTPQSERHDGKWNVSKYRLNRIGSSVSCIDITSSGYFWVDGLQLSLTLNGSSGTSRGLYFQGATGELKLSNCIIKGVPDGYTPTVFDGFRCYNVSPNYVVKLWNNIVYDFNAGTGYAYHTSYAAQGCGAGSYIYNCTAQNSKYGFILNENVIAKNNISQDMVTDGFFPTASFHASCSDNCSDIASDIPNASGRTGEVLFVNEGTDFHLDSSDTVAKGYGADLSGIFTTDIDGQTITTWSIGADGQVSSGAASLTIGDVYHAIFADTIILIQVHALTVQDSWHVLYSNNLDLVSKHILIINEINHGLSNDIPTLTQGNILALQSAYQAHILDGNLTLTSKHTLDIADSHHVVFNDSINLAGVYTLSVDNPYHSISTDSIDLSQTHTLVIGDSYHTVISDALYFGTTYYVAKTGNDSPNDGKSLDYPFLTVQKALDVVAAGDRVFVRTGTYSEGLIIKTSGTASQIVLVENYNGESVTISSGNYRTIRTNANQHYYTFRGLSLIANYYQYADGKYYSIDFVKTGGDVNDVWFGEDNYPNGGNNGFVLDDCYIEGSVRFYGNYCQVINSELNGNNQWATGIFAGYGSCDHLSTLTNTIYDYTTRGIWAMQFIRYAEVAYNTIYGCSRGINMDGAGNRGWYQTVHDNLVWDYDDNGIQLEGFFESDCYNNKVLSWSGTGKGTGIEGISYGPPIDDTETRSLGANSLIYNNVVHHSNRAGIELISTAGWGVYNNIIDENLAGSGYYAGLSLTNDGSAYYCSYCTIKNNIVSNCEPVQVWIKDPAGGFTEVVFDYNLYYHASDTNVAFNERLSTNYTLTAWKSAGFDTNSTWDNPDYTNISTHDFSPTSVSPSIDTGTTVSDVTTDILGVARPQRTSYDIGAYEYNSIVIQDAFHSIITDSIELNLASVLTISDPHHAIITDAVELSQVHNLIVSDSYHAVVTDAVELAEESFLTVQDSYHILFNDGIELASIGSLTVQDSYHTVLTDSIDLTGKHILDIQDSFHAVSNDSIVLAQAHMLILSEINHGLSNDVIVLTQGNILALQEANHALSSDNIDLVGFLTLSISDSYHSILTDSIALSQVHILDIQEGTSNVNNTSIILSTPITLSIDDGVSTCRSSCLPDNVNYVRVTVTDGFDIAPAGDTLISKIKAMESSGGADVCTQNASASYDTSNAYYAFDSDQNTKWGFSELNQGVPQWIQTVLANKKRISHYTIGYIKTAFQSGPKSWNFQVSNDGITFYTLDTVTDTAAWPVDTYEERDFTCESLSDLVLTTATNLSIDNIIHAHNGGCTPVNGRYIRWTFTSGNNNDTLRVGELEAFNLSSSDLCTGGTTNAEDYPENAYLAFDDSHTSSWDVDTQWRGWPTWIQYCTTDPHIITRYSVGNRNSFSDNPKGWYVEVSTDGSTWYLVSTVADQTSWAADEHKYFYTSPPITNIDLIVPTILSVQDSFHSVSNDNIDLDTTVILNVSDSYHSILTDSIDFSQANTLVIDDPYHSILTDSIDLTGKNTLEIQDSYHILSNDSVDLTSKHILEIQDSYHSILTDSIDLTGKNVLNIQDSYHVVSNDNIIFLSAGVLEIQDSYHAINNDNIILTGKNVLEIQDSYHTVFSDNLLFSISFELEIQDSFHTINNDSIALTSKHILEIQDNFHTVSNDGISLAQHSELEIQDSYHAINNSSIVLSQKNTIAVQDIYHAVINDGIDLTGKHTLDIQDSYHLVTNDDLSLSGVGTLEIQNSFHTTSNSALSLTGKQTLIIQESQQVLLSDNVNLIGKNILEIQDSHHIALGDNVNLTSKHILEIQDSYHVVSNDAVGLGTAGILILAEANHALSSGNIDLIGKHTIDIQDSYHTIFSSNADLVQHFTLEIQDSWLTVITDAITVTQKHILDIQDSYHGLFNDSISLGETSALEIQDSYHIVTNDDLDLVQKHILEIQDSYHGLFNGVVVLLQKHILTVQDSYHVILVDGIVLVQSMSSEIQDSFHAVSNDGIILIQKHDLELSDSTHQISNDSIDLISKHILEIQDITHGVISTDITLVGFSTELIVQDIHHILLSDNIIIYRVLYVASGSYVILTTHNGIVELTTHNGTVELNSADCDVELLSM